MMRKICLSVWLVWLLVSTGCGGSSTPESVYDTQDTLTGPETESRQPDTLETDSLTTNEQPTSSEEATDSATNSEASSDTDHTTVTNQTTDSEDDTGADTYEDDTGVDTHSEDDSDSYLSTDSESNSGDTQSQTEQETVSQTETQSQLEPDGSCAAPYLIETLPFLAASTTAGDSNLLETYDESCGTGQYAGPDEVYALEVEKGVLYTITVYGIGILDAVLLVLDTCSENVPCSAFADHTGVGGSETVLLTADSDGTVFIVVDAEDSEGQYALSVTAQVFDTESSNDTETGSESSSASETGTQTAIDTDSYTDSGSDTGTASETDSETVGDLLDFGDALDVPGVDAFYPTLMAHDGARHVVHNYGCFLGQTVDDELDASVFDPGQGDDLADLDDEDGVEITAVVSGQVNTVEVFLTCFGLSAEVVLQGWIDFNGDYDWQDEGEQIFENEPLNEGLNLLKFKAPEVVKAGLNTFARFRLSSLQDLLPEGLAPDGEVEDYAVRVLASPSADYGDLPEGVMDPSYQTTRDNGGPYHTVGNDVYLGASIDAEEDGAPSDGALGDDDAGDDDEDGVTGIDTKELVFHSGRNKMLVTSMCKASIESCALQAWIDLNRDGDFADKGEAVVRDLRLPTGEHEVEFSLPTFSPGTSFETYMRVRYSTLSGLPPTGFAPDGEVEDYLVSVSNSIGPDPL